MFSPQVAKSEAAGRAAGRGMQESRTGEAIGGHTHTARTRHTVRALGVQRMCRHRGSWRRRRRRRRSVLPPPPPLLLAAGARRVLVPLLVPSCRRRRSGLFWGRRPGRGWWREREKGCR
ncbi:hypothetical protein KIL84_013873 [Mauremys mutica]|uniref:Uncharacterized protein n=1 Tax=Mauremys mutica TaxID=74926 RepID=A0A9D3WXQ9_9SAUR|nr:hypothetical protein KIL84_013873 [Mauremys mutica]